MPDYITRLLFLKQLYFKVGKTVLWENYTAFLKQVDYDYFETEYSKLLQSLEYKNVIFLQDKNSVIFNLLAKRLLQEHFENCDIIFCTLSPFYFEDVIDYIFIPAEKLHISNNSRYDDCAPCLGYRKANHPDIIQNLEIAKEFFEKAEISLPLFIRNLP